MGDIGNFGLFWVHFRAILVFFFDILMLIYCGYLGGGQYIDIDISLISRVGRYLNIDILSILTKISKYCPLIWVGQNIGHAYFRGWPPVKN